MLRNLLCIFLIIIICISGGCKKEYKFLQDSSQISSIEIVELTDNIIDGQIEQIVICVVGDTKGFMEDFEKIDCRGMFDDPTGVEPGEKAIKIIYNSGEYELIGSN